MIRTEIEITAELVRGAVRVNPVAAWRESKVFTEAERRAEPAEEVTRLAEL